MLKLAGSFVERQPAFNPQIMNALGERVDLQPAAVEEGVSGRLGFHSYYPKKPDEGEGDISQPVVPAASGDDEPA